MQKKRKKKERENDGHMRASENLIYSTVMQIILSTTLLYKI